MITAGAGLATRLATDRHWLLERLEGAVRHARRRSDPEAVHDVRVTTRQLEAALDLWRSILPPRRRQRVRRTLRRLRRALAPAREVRICLGLLDQRFGALDPEARVAAARLQDLLQRRLERLDGRAARRCARSDMERLRGRFERTWEATASVLGFGTAALEAARARLEVRRARARAALRAAVQDTADERLHAARLAVKRWRYLLERFAAAEPDVDRSEQRWLKSVQDALGRIQDLAVLRERITRMCPPGAPPEATPSSGTLRSLVTGIDEERAERVREFGRLAAAAAHGAPHGPEVRLAPPWREA